MYHHWILSPPLRQYLIKALLKAPDIALKETRDSVVRQLPQALQEVIRDDPQAQLHVALIIDVCLQHDWGMEALYDALHFIFAGTYAIEVISAAFQRCNPRPLPLSELASLKESLRAVQISGDLVRSCYRNYAARYGPCSEPDERGSLFCVLEHLSCFAKPQDQSHPIVGMLRSLIKHMEPEEKSAVNNWLAERSDLLGVSYDTSDNSPESKSNTGSHPSLLIELAPSDNGTYRVQAWFWEQHATMIFADDQRYTLNQVREIVLPNIYERCVDQLAVGDEGLIVEFFLPIALITEAVDQWDFLFEGEKLGFRYKVAVRLQERAATKIYWPAWFSRWKSLTSLRRPITPGLLARVSNIEDIHQKYLRLELDTRPVLLLSCGLPESEMRKKQLLGLLLRAGTPVALWPRHVLTDVRTCDELLYTIIAGDASEVSTDDIPALIRHQRKQAYICEQEHIGHHLSFIWDNPERLPHRLLHLAAPIREGV